MLWPAIVKFAARLKPVCIVLVIGLPLIRLGLWTAGVDWMWLHMMMPLRADAFAMGALVAMGWRVPRLALLIAPALLVLVLTGNYARDSVLVGTVGYSLNALAAAAVLSLAMAGGRFGRFLENRSFLHVGKVSYGVYLYHPLCLIATPYLVDSLHVNLNTLARSAAYVTIGFALAIVVASLSFRLFESPILKLKTYFEPGGLAASRSTPEVA